MKAAEDSMEDCVGPPPLCGDLSYKSFLELMSRRVSEIVLVSTPYDAFIMEEDGRLAERIIHEYRGLNLSRPPRLTRVPTAKQALSIIRERKIDLVITMPSVDDMDAGSLAAKIKKIDPDLPVFLLSHNLGGLHVSSRISSLDALDGTFVWSGNTDLLLALVKLVEDRLNVDFDTKKARVRVIIVVEDSPLYRSSLLPRLYREIVTQTQAVMEDAVNEANRLLRMRARPKILLAESFEEARELYQQYRDFLLCVISDVRFEKDGVLDDRAGFKLLDILRRESPELPLLVLSSEESNRREAERIPAVFLDKNEQGLLADIRCFLEDHLGFGDFVFRDPDGREVARAANLSELEHVLSSVPDESLDYHSRRNHFSTWFMARSEIRLASELRPIRISDFPDLIAAREFLIRSIQETRRARRRGVITDFSADDFDPATAFVKVGKGSLGGKARGLAFASALLVQHEKKLSEMCDVQIHVPRVLALTTEGFDAFIRENRLKTLWDRPEGDKDVAEAFRRAAFPKWLEEILKVYLSHVTTPLAVRSSSLLEDARYMPCAGVYQTYMIPNQDPDPSVRLARLIDAVKTVWASTFFETPRAFAASSLLRSEEEKMGVVIQEVIGSRYGDYFYPAVSGVAQSYNFYPISHLKPEEGLAHIAFGLGKTVVDGEAAVRFSPGQPGFLPQFSTVDDILGNTQRFFYALDMSGKGDSGDGFLLRLDVARAEKHAAFKALAGTYSQQDHRIRDVFSRDGYKVLTFASLLKHDAVPLSRILPFLLDAGKEGMGCPVEIEFAINLPEKRGEPAEFALLQLRPMAVTRSDMEVRISEEDKKAAFGFSAKAMGNGVHRDILDVVYVPPGRFDPAKTLAVAEEIATVNARLAAEKRKYLLIGPGRWGSNDRWLGIPVKWHDIAGVRAIVETSCDGLKADPSQGSHFFHNITSLGIGYITATTKEEGYVDTAWLDALEARSSGKYVRHVELEKPITLKIDGKTSRAVLLSGQGGE